MDRSAPTHRRTRPLALIAGAALLGCGWTAVLAQDSADVEVRLVKGEAIRISKIDDWVPAVRDASGTVNVISGTYDVQCVYTTTGLYRLSIDSANGTGGNPLVVVKPPGTRPQDRMRYYLAIQYYPSGGSGYVRQDFGTSSFTINRDLRGSTDTDCVDERSPNGFNLAIGAYVLENGFDQADPGIYRDTVTITVSPV